MYNVINLLASSAGQVSDIEGDINSFSIKSVGIATIVLVVLLVLASQVVKDKKHKKLKKPLFIAIAMTIILPSLMLAGSTVYVNTISESGGPVHWHTDLEFWVCGEEIELRDPFEFASNKVGTASYHEHDDKRIHLEGVVIEKDYDASLEKFMVVIGGAMSSDQLIIPTNDDIFENDLDGDVPSGDKSHIQNFRVRDGDGRALLSVKNGDTCSSSSDDEAEIQAFLLRYDKGDDTYSQTKLEEPERYIMRDESVVPPGDCVIVEFDREKIRTERLCKQYGVRDSSRCTEFGVKKFNPDLCNISEKKTTGGTR